MSGKNSTHRRMAMRMWRIGLLLLVVLRFFGGDAGVVWAGYTTNGNGTATDTITGLTWQQADDGVPRTWEQALSYCEGLDLGGNDDWRLPNALELQSIVDYSRFNPSIDPVFECRSVVYWSGTTADTNPGVVWGAYFYNGFVYGHYKWSSLYTRCVRGGISETSGSLTISKLGSGTGRVVSDPAGIDCGNDCREDYPLDTSVTMNAIPDQGSAFSGWSGGTSSSATACAVTVDRNMSIVATFNRTNTPAPISPRDNSDLPPAKNLTLEWSTVEGAVGYVVEIDNDCSFNAPEVAGLYLPGASSTRMTWENFLSDGTYCWRVRAKLSDGTNSEWSSSWSFTYHLPTAARPLWIPFYRLYKGGTLRDHFYTTNAWERDNAVNTMGWQYERIECSISSVKASGMIPLFRLYYDDGTLKDHFYTTDENERDAALALDAGRRYAYEGICGFVYPESVNGAVALYRLYKADKVDHFYCTRLSERDFAKATWGFVDEANHGVQCYVMPAESAVPLAGGRPSGFYGSSNTATGAFLYSHTDVSFPSPGPALHLERSYNSRSTNRTIFGTGWTHSYDWHIYQNELSYVVHRGNGRMDYYNLDGSPKEGYGGVYDVLTRDGDELTIITLDKTQYKFGYLETIQDGFFLKEILDRHGNSLHLEYAGGKLSKITDPVGRYITFAYDASGNLAAIYDPQLTRTLYFHVNEKSNNLEWSKDWKGNTTLYTYEKDGQGSDTHRIEKIVRPGNKTLVINKYVDGLLLEQNDALGNTTTYSYDASGNTVITDALGHQSIHAHDDSYELTKLTDSRSYSEQSAYNVDHELRDFSDRRNHKSSFDYLGQPGDVSNSVRGNLTATIHDISGDTSIVAESGADATIKTQWDYDTSVSNRYPSFPVSYTDAMGKKTEYEYDENGNVILVKDPMVLKDPAENLPMTREYYANGQIKKVTDKNGRITQYFYEDEYKNLTRVVDPLGGEARYSYDAAGRRTAVTNARGFTTTYEYDLNDNLSKTTDPLGNQAGSEYDENNNLTKTVDAKGHATFFEYDAKDQLLSRTDAGNHRVTYAYDALGRRNSITDENGQITRYEYDEEGNLIKILTPLDTISFSHDANGNLTKTVDGRSKTVQNSYNTMDQLSSTKDPLNNTTTYFYRKDGNIFSRQDPNGVITEYSYDDLGQLTAINYVAYPDDTIHFKYDHNGNLKEMRDPAGNTTYVYDENDRLVSVTDPYSKTVSYAYDLLGNRTAITYPGDKTVAYEYDGLNRLSKVIDWLGGVTAYFYDEVGNVVQVSNANGTKAFYAYDDANRLSSLSNQKNDGTVISSYSYTLDNLGNITNCSITEPLQPAYQNSNITYGYDDANRLTVGGEFSYVYDNNGNLTQRIKAGETTTFAYNHENLLTTTSGVSNIHNVYNGLGQRISRSENGVDTRYVLDVATSLPSVVAETDESGNVRAYYVYGIGLISRISAEGSRLVYHFNNRGDTLALTDTTGNVTDTYTYDEFGQLFNSTGTTVNPFKFVGKFGVMDEGSNFCFMRARLYDASSGRFLNEDRFGYEKGSYNLYVYVSNNPIRYIDPVGLKAFDFLDSIPAQMIMQFCDYKTYVNAAVSIANSIWHRTVIKYGEAKEEIYKVFWKDPYSDIEIIDFFKLEYDLTIDVISIPSDLIMKGCLDSPINEAVKGNIITIDEGEMIKKIASDGSVDNISIIIGAIGDVKNAKNMFKELHYARMSTRDFFKNIKHTKNAVSPVITIGNSFLKIIHSHYESKRDSSKH